MGEIALLGVVLIAVFFITYLIQGAILLLRVTWWLAKGAISIGAWVIALVLNPRATLAATFSPRPPPSPLDWSNIDLDA